MEWWCTSMISSFEPVFALIGCHCCAHTFIGLFSSNSHDEYSPPALSPYPPPFYLTGWVMQRCAYLWCSGMLYLPSGAEQVKFGLPSPASQDNPPLSSRVHMFVVIDKMHIEVGGALAFLSC